jgi:hypothetical protein
MSFASMFIGQYVVGPRGHVGMVVGINERDIMVAWCDGGRHIVWDEFLRPY